MPNVLSKIPISSRLTERATDFVGLVTTPLLPSDYLDLVSPLRAGADLRGKIVEVRPETRDSASLTIKPGRGWAGHVPGQYVRIGIDVNGVREWRAYSLTSPVDASDTISITVKAIPDGKVSNHLVRNARPGTLIHLDQACGEFVLPKDQPEKILFVTAGSGVTPVMGMLRNLPAGGSDVVLVHSSPTPDDVIFANELRDMSDNSDLRLIERHTDTHGVLTPADLSSMVTDLGERMTWACGPIPMLDAIEEHWADMGLSENLNTERFRPTVFATGEGGTVTFTDTGLEVEAGGGTSLLDAGEEAGVLMPSGCRMGICFGCVAPLREGTVRDLRNGDLTTASPGDGVLVQTCVSAAAGSCQIDL